MSEKPPEWEITIDRFDGFVPSWFSNDWPSVGTKYQASDMADIDLTDPNRMKPGPAPENLRNGDQGNGDQEGAVTTLVKSFMRQVASQGVSFAIGGDYLYNLSTNEVSLTGDWPHQILGVDSEGEDVIAYKGQLFYFYNWLALKTPEGDIGMYDSDSGFTDDWGSTIPSGAAYLEYAPHQAINGGDDEVYFANGHYVGKISEIDGVYTLSTQALNFWEDSEIMSLTWNENRIKIALNRPNCDGSIQSAIYNWNGYSSSWEGDPIEVKGRIGALYTKNGIDYVWWRDVGTTGEFNFGYVSGTQVKGIKKCTGSLPLYYQVGEYKGFIAWMSDGLVYLHGQSDPESPVKFFQYTRSLYPNGTNGGLGMPFEELLTASSFSTDDGINYSLAKAGSDYSDDSYWKTRVFPVMLPGYVSQVDKIQMNTETFPVGSKLETYFFYNGNCANEIIDSMLYSATSSNTFHKVLNKSLKIEDFLLKLLWDNIGEITSVGVDSMGTGYTEGDVLTLIGGQGDATVTVTEEIDGMIYAVALLNGGTGYVVGTSAVTGGTGNDDAVIDIAGVGHDTVKVRSILIKGHYVPEN